MQQRGARLRANAAGFTLVELLIVIGIIVLLISILIPVVSKVRQAGMSAAAQSFITQLGRSIEVYEQDFGAYPGPLSNQEVWNQNNASNSIVVESAALSDPNTQYADQQPSTDFAKKITMPENLVLGMMGGLVRKAGDPKLYYDPRQVGSGAQSLSLTGPVKRYKPYIEAVNLSWRQTEDKGGGPQPQESPADKKTGHFRDDADQAGADDSIIPEILDTFSDPLPILYLRAKRGAQAKSGSISAINNTIVTFNEADPSDRAGQYDLHQIIAYTDSKIGVGRKSITPAGWQNPKVHGLRAENIDKVQPLATMSKVPPQPLMVYTYPFNAYPYFRNQALSSPKETDPEMVNLASPRNDIPHQKDGFILISAGPDRIYGTEDDMTNFGPVLQQ